MVLSATSSWRLVRSRCLHRALGEFGVSRALFSSSSSGGSGAGASAGKRSGEKKGKKGGSSGKQASAGAELNPEEIEELNTFSAIGGMGVAAFGAVGLAAIGAVGAFQMAKWAAGEAGYTITGKEGQGEGARSFNKGGEQ